MQGHTTRSVTCWRLTESGWALANLAAAADSPLVLSREEVVRQMDRLASVGDSWAQDLLDAKIIVDSQRSEAPPTPRDVVNLLWRIFESDQKPARQFAIDFDTLIWPPFDALNWPPY
jgi:hypothetical protein